MRFRACKRFLSVMILAVAFALSGCGGGGSETVAPETPDTIPPTPETPDPTTPPAPETPDPTTPPLDPQAGRALYTVSVAGGNIGTTPVSVGTDLITIGGQTASLNASTQVGNQFGHYRVFDAQGATSGPALELHFFGQDESYNHLRFGSWAKGVVSLNPGFTIGNEYGAFLAIELGSGLTPVSNMQTVGSATYQGHYTGYVDREGVGVSQVVGQVAIAAVFGPGGVGDGGIIVELLPPDPSRSSFAVPSSGILGYTDRVLINGVIEGNGFENDLTATQTILDQTFPREDTIMIHAAAGCPCLYSQGGASSGGMRGGFFGTNAGEAGGTYQFTVGRTRAAGSFGGTLQ